MSENFAIFLDRAKFYITDLSSSLLSTLCRPSSELKINGRTFTLNTLLGEGAFSFVYLCTDTSSGRQFALKKIRCPNSESLRLAQAEIEAYRRFKSDHIIKVLDSAVVQDDSGEGKIVWVFLPYYERGNLQDLITRSLLSSPPTFPPERQLVRLFHGTCLAVQAMHTFKPQGGSSSASQQQQQYPPTTGQFTRTEEMEMGGLGIDDDGGESGEGRGLLGGGEVMFDVGSDDEEEDGKGKGKEVLRKGEERAKASVGAASSSLGEGIVPYAHRDIKPANVMLAQDGITPILMDLGSCIPARIPIKTRNEALVQQDIAAEHSSMPFRAPELFDVRTNQTLTEACDIWSLGCTLFALAYSHTPFEPSPHLYPGNYASTAAGGSIAMAVASGSYKHPPKTPYSEAFKGLMDACLKVDPAKRLGIQEVIERCEALMREGGGEELA